jgi:hypothetical protein
MRKFTGFLLSAINSFRLLCDPAFEGSPYSNKKPTKTQIFAKKAQTGLFRRLSYK